MPKYKAVFDKWASIYDEEVDKASSTDDWMFGGYDSVLDKAVEYSVGEGNNHSSVLDIGIGTGNLAARFLKRGLQLYGIDPSRKMRKICSKKYPGINVLAGDFLKYPHSMPLVDLIVSAYAFHHLTEAEKTKAIVMMKNT
jgi:putative AdoMet-dependent methyltransferase